ncbi:MAG: hypothetical protein ACRCX2_00205 [Paraclostridium sp.]|jgi:hypothetical protein
MFQVPILDSESDPYFYGNELRKLYAATSQGNMMNAIITPDVQPFPRPRDIVPDETGLNPETFSEVMTGVTDKKRYMSETVAGDTYKLAKITEESPMSELDKQQEYYREYTLDERVMNELDNEAGRRRDNYLGEKSEDFVKEIRQSQESYVTAENYLNLPSDTGKAPRESLAETIAETIAESSANEAERLRRKRALFSSGTKKTQETQFQERFKQTEKKKPDYEKMFKEFMRIVGNDFE